MGDHIFKVALAEITTIRVKCKGKKCGATVEVPVTELDRIAQDCPFCGLAYVHDVQERVKRTRLAALQDAIAKLREVEDRYEVEFPINLDAHAKKPGGDADSCSTN